MTLRISRSAYTSWEVDEIVFDHGVNTYKDQDVETSIDKDTLERMDQNKGNSGPRKA